MSEIIGYLYYTLNDGLRAHLSKLTMGIWEVLTPVSYEDMTLVCLDGGSIDRCIATISACHNAGIPCLASVFAPWSDPSYLSIYSDATLGAELIQNIVQIVSSYGFDGVNIDWECDNRGATAEQLTTFYRELREQLPDPLIINSSQNYGMPKMSPDILQYLDNICVMTYDDTSVWYFTLDSMRAGVEVWTNAGFPADRIIAGVNFHSRTALVSGAWGLSYKSIIDAYNPAPELNEVAGYYYNGADLVSQKATWIRDNGFGGIFCYDTSGDAFSDERSLLGRIYTELGEIVPPPPPSNTTIIPIILVGIIVGVVLLNRR